MFTDLSWSHILLLLVVTLVVVGPQDLPKVMRKLGQWTAKARNMADQFRASFDEMARQSELDELRKEIDELRNARPLAETQAQVEEAMKLPDISLNSEAEAAPAPPAAETAEPFAPPADPPATPAPESDAPHEGGISPPPP
jgi:sec-independent protein translocase protein TatB